MKKFPKRMFLWMMSALLVLSLSATMAFANENVTSPTYNPVSYTHLDVYKRQR